MNKLYPTAEERKILEKLPIEALILFGSQAQGTAGKLKSIPYEELDLNKDWATFDIFHELTDNGIEKFSSDWNNLLH